MSRELHFKTQCEACTLETKVMLGRLATASKSDVVSRETLTIVVDRLVARSGHVITAEDRDFLLDECIMNGDAQEERMKWRDQRERSGGLAALPGVDYDTMKLVERLTAYIDKKNRELNA